MDWNDLARELTELRKRVPAQDVAQMLDPLERALSARAIPVEQYAMLVHEVGQIFDEIERGAQPDDAIAGARARAASAFWQPGWEPTNVNQAGKIVQYFFGDLGVGTSPDDEAALLPVVLVAMTVGELDDLTSGRAFDGRPEILKQDFGRLTDLLDGSGTADWMNRYGDGSQEWRPFGPDGSTISEVIDDAVDQLNIREGYRPLVKAEYIDVRTVGTDRYRLRGLREHGCLVLIDSISMRHPTLQHSFQASLLDAYARTSVATIAPVGTAFSFARTLAVVLDLSLADMEFAKRQVDYYEEDDASCREIADRSELRKWLVNRIKRLGISDPPAAPSIRDFMTVGRA